MDKIEIKKNSLQNNSLYKLISSGAEVKPFPLLRGTRLSQWIQSRVNQKGAGISLQATNLLMEIIGGDLHTMSNEIDKLAAYTGGRLIEEQDIRMVVSASQEADIFAPVDLHGPEKRMARITQSYYNRIVAPQILVCWRDKLNANTVKELRTLEGPATEFRESLGIVNHPLGIDREGGEVYLERLKEMYSSLLETDLSIKTGA